MKKMFASLAFLLLLISFLPGSVGQALQSSAPDVADVQQDASSFSFAELKEEERHMFGPFATETLLFGLPANWKLTADAQLELEYTVLIQSANLAGQGQFYGGALTVQINDQVVSVLPLSQSGRLTQTISIPLAAFESARRDGRQELTISLSSGESCLYDTKVEVIVHSSSRFIIPHEVTAPDTNLVNFPRPLYQDSIFTDSALIIVPDHPSAAELQAAVSVAAGLEARTGSALSLSVVSHSELNETLLSSTHLVFVGNAGSLPTLYQLATPLALKDGSFAGAGDAGVLQMIASPWSPDRAVLIVSGNNDEATLKAGQALSTGVIRPSASASNVALIDSVNNKIYAEQATLNQSLENLGYESTTFSGRGESTETIQFYVPIGQTVTPEAYFEASISNSTLLDYARSGVFFVLNDQPIGSIRLSDETANKANNRIQIAIPPSAIRSGLNTLDVVAVLAPLDECADPNQAGLFVTLWADSLLYMPLMPVPVDSVELPDLSNYPSPFSLSPDLGKVAFVLEKDNPGALQSAIRIAGYLGGQSEGVIFTPSVFYADETASVDLSPYNIIAIGVPSKMGFIGGINEKLPVPFEAGSDIANEEALRVEYRVEPNEPAGYIQLLPSPWDPSNLIIAVLGNSAQGITWSTDALLSEVSRQSMIGNFAVVRSNQVQAVDTRYQNLWEPVVGPEDTPTPAVESTPVVKPSISTTSWIPVALGISAILMVIVIIIAAAASKRKIQ
ncbi:hypothetical protein MASR2M66_17140 [Chloroflexota bacterium]